MSDTLPEQEDRIIHNYCIDCKAVAQPDCDERGHVVGTLGQVPKEAIAFTDGTLRDIRDTNRLAPISEQPASAVAGESERVILNSDLMVRPLQNTTKFLLVTEEDWPIAEFYRAEEAEGLAYEHNRHHSLRRQNERLVEVLRECQTDLKAAIDRLPPRLHDHEDMKRCKSLLAQIDAAINEEGK